MNERGEPTDIKYERIGTHEIEVKLESKGKERRLKEIFMRSVGKRM